MNLAFPTPGTIYKLAESGLAVDVITDPAIDQQAMSARAIICTPSVDRARDRMNPLGGEYDDYKKNPVVLWGHGLDSNISVPIAKCETPSGELALSPSADAIEATAFFTNKARESAQIFDLIVERIVRATSIHFLPIEFAHEVDDSGGTITHHKRWKMLEWSWGCIGVNPDAVAKVLTRNRLAGDPICESIAKTLRPFAPRAKGNGIGTTFEALSMSKTIGKAKTMTPEEEAAAAAAAGDAASAKTGGDGGEVVETDTDEGQGEMPPSVRVASAVKASLGQLVANVEAAKNLYEDPRAKEYLEGAFMEQCKALMTEVDGLISELGGKVEEAESPSEDDAEETMKTFLASGVRSRMQAIGAIAPLAALSTAKNLKPEQRLAIESVVKSVRGMVQAAKKQAGESLSTATAKQLEETQKQFASVSKTLETLQTSLKELMPAGK